ncbi:MAG TPA: ureidoglycolate hydrolase [Gemmatimonadetes bacterium]|nr:ureidoglycolate hydrolase [Gemmatimonadota bacterium]
MRVKLQDPDPSVFAPFGAFLEPPAGVGDRSMFSEWLEPVPGLSHQCHLNRVAPSTLPLTVKQVEHHPHAAQLFLPMGVSHYLVTVMPSDAVGSPDSAHALAFVVPGTLGVAYHPGTWHAGIAVLDAEASFAVLMWRGEKDDDVFAAIPPIELQPEHTKAFSKLDSAIITKYRK